MRGPCLPVLLMSPARATAAGAPVAAVILPPCFFVQCEYAPPWRHAYTQQRETKNAAWPCQSTCQLQRAATSASASSSSGGGRTPSMSPQSSLATSLRRDVFARTEGTSVWRANASLMPVRLSTSSQRCVLRGSASQSPPKPTSPSAGPDTSNVTLVAGPHWQRPARPTQRRPRARQAHHWKKGPAPADCDAPSKHA